VDELCAGIAKGRGMVSVSRLAEICPQGFQAPKEEVTIKLPLQRLIEQLGFVEYGKPHLPGLEEGWRHSPSGDQHHVWRSVMNPAHAPRQNDHDKAPVQDPGKPGENSRADGVSFITRESLPLQRKVIIAPIFVENIKTSASSEDVSEESK